MSVRNRIKNYIIEEALIPPGGRVLLGLSGGADSVCLLWLLKSLEAELSFSLHALHVQHGIRGEEAERDLRFSREMSAALAVPFHAVHLDVPAYAAEKGLGLEEAARLLRYRALEETLADWLAAEGAAAESGRIAVAHHQEDQAETVLHNLIRGTGLRGLGGMQPRQDRLIRPLLTVTREEILGELSAAGLSYVTDSTNAALQYTRNRLRQRVLPELRDINARAVEHISAAAALLGEADALLRQQAESWLAAHRESAPAGDTESRKSEAGDVLTELRVSLPALRQEKPLLRRYIFMALLNAMDTPRKDWGAVHLNALDGLLFRQGGAHLDLPYRMSGDIRGKQLILRTHREINSMKRRKKA